MKALAIGEMLIDFTSALAGAGEQMTYTAHAGGAPVNVLVQLAKLGVETGFIGKVGDDPFGHVLRDELIRQGVGIAGLRFTREAGTTLAFVTNGADGERTFQFYRNPGADQLMAPEEVPLADIRQADLFHFGSVSMTHSPSREATLAAARAAKEAGVIVSFDPNVREALWPGGIAEAVVHIREALPLADIVKVSEEELALLTGASDWSSGAERLAAESSAAVIWVTRGAQGSCFRTSRASGMVEGFPVQAVDTTGAGDAFCGTALYGLLASEAALGEQTAEEMQRIARFANAAGALATTRKGAIPALPGLSEIEKLL